MSSQDFVAQYNSHPGVDPRVLTEATVYGLHNFGCQYTHGSIVVLAVVLTNIFSKTNQLFKEPAFYQEQSMGVHHVTLHRRLLLEREHSMKIGIRPLHPLKGFLVLDICCKQSSTTDSRFSKNQSSLFEHSKVITNRLASDIYV